MKQLPCVLDHTPSSVKFALNRSRSCRSKGGRGSCQLKIRGRSPQDSCHHAARQMLHDVTTRNRSTQ